LRNVNNGIYRLHLLRRCNNPPRRSPGRCVTIFHATARRAINYSARLSSTRDSRNTVRPGLRISITLAAELTISPVSRRARGRFVVSRMRCDHREGAYICIRRDYAALFLKRSRSSKHVASQRAGFPLIIPDARAGREWARGHVLLIPSTARASARRNPLDYGAPICACVRASWRFAIWPGEIPRERRERPTVYDSSSGARVGEQRCEWHRSLRNGTSEPIDATVHHRCCRSFRQLPAELLPAARFQNGSAVSMRS